MSYFAKRPRTFVNADDASSLSGKSDHRPFTEHVDLHLETLGESDGPLGTPRLLRHGVPGGDLDSLEETEAVKGIIKDSSSIDQSKNPTSARSVGILGLFRSLTARPAPDETKSKDDRLEHPHHSISMAGFKTHIPADIDELESNYRVLPLAIGCIIPVSILINVPSLTSPWVGSTEFDPVTKVWSSPEDVAVPNWMSGMVVGALVMSILCNLCVLSRFLERHVWHSVVFSLIAATLQDFLCIGVVVPFCLKYPQSKGYVYLEGFWTMVVSMIFSMSATIMLSIDIYRTPHFRLHGSGVTHKQRILIAEAMSLCFYLAIGALIFIWIEKWTFVESLFFVMVTITTIGFGNTVPKTSAGRIFVIFYGAGGIVLFAMAVNAIRYVILEDLHRQFALRAKERKTKREARRRERKEERLREKERRKRVQKTLQQLALANGASILDPNQNSRSHHFSILPKHFTIHGSSKRISSHFANENSDKDDGKGENNSTTRSAPGDFPYSLFGAKSTSDRDGKKHHQVIEMTRSASSTSGIATSRKNTDDIFNEHGQSDQQLDLEEAKTTAQTKNKEKTESFSSIRRHRSLFGLIVWAIRYLYRITGHACGWRGAEFCSQIAEMQPTAKEQREADKRLAHEESMEEYKRRLRFSFLMFLSFWLIGAAVFRSLEGWTFGMAMYFSFVAFSTIGYGDLVPLTLAGRSLFLAYCLVGIVTLTFLASLVSELLSKSMRRHVVQTQLRRSERFLEHGDRLVQSPTERDTEHGEVEAGMDGLNELSGDGGLQEERMRTLQNLASQATTTGDGEEEAQSKTCQGSLRNLVQVSRDFDTLLQKVLGMDYGGSAGISQAKDTMTTPEDAVESSSESILEYLEKGDGEDSLYLSPSISRDVTSTSSIHRHSRAKGRSYMDLQSTGTYHGAGQSPVSSSQFSITAWPTSAAAAVAGTSVPTKSSPQSRSNSPRRSQSTAQSSTTPITTHRHNSDGTVTIAAVHWQHLIEYSRQFRVLTDSCDQTLKRLLAWEADEKKMCLKRRQTKERQQRLLRERRLRLFELGGTYGAVDDGIEDEEELDEWEEEGTHYEDDETTVNNDERGIYSADGGEGGSIRNLDDSEALDKTRENIADALLGSDRRQPSSQSRPEIVPLQTVPKNSASRAVHQQRAIAERARVIGVESLVGTRAVPGRGRSFHPPTSNDQSADESSTTAVSATGNGGAITSSSHPGARATRMTARDRETGTTSRRGSRSRSRHRSHTGHDDGGNVGHAVRATLQRPPLHTIHTNVAFSSEGDGEVIGEDP